MKLLKKIPPPPPYNRAINLIHDLLGVNWASRDKTQKNAKGGQTSSDECRFSFEASVVISHENLFSGSSCESCVRVCGLAQDLRPRLVSSRTQQIVFSQARLAACRHLITKTTFSVQCASLDKNDYLMSFHSHYGMKENILSVFLAEYIFIFRALD